MNLPIPQKAILKPITNTSGSGIMALWLFDGVVYGYAWPTGRLNRLFLGPKMFSLTTTFESVQPDNIVWLDNEMAVTSEGYITGPVIFSLSYDFTVLPVDKVRVGVLSADVGIEGNFIMFSLEELSMVDILPEDKPQKLVPVHRVFFTADHNHVYVTNETELEIILSGKHGKANYEGIAFYAVSAGRE